MRRRDGGATEEDRATMRNSEISQVTMTLDSYCITWFYPF